MPDLIMSATPVSPEEVPDEIIREVLLPYARRCYGLPVDLPEDVYRSMQSAHTAYDSKWVNEQTALVYEGCALTGDDSVDTEPVRKMYEDAFFDVRNCLSDVDTVVGLVFRPMLEDLLPKAHEFEGKVVAYALGSGEFRCWMRGEYSAGILVLREWLAKLEAFRTSLVGLGLAVEKAWAKALGQAIHAVQSGAAPTKYAKFLEQPGWRERLEYLISSLGT